MWKGPGQDPGGGPETGPPPGSSQELSDLKDQFEQQQVLIAQLKEMIRKNEQSNVTQEKVDEYMNTLSKRGGRAKKLKRDDDNKKTAEIPASQKISLLRQQVEENKVRLAERGKSKKGIEDMVTQLKAQLDDSQQLISPLNLSLQDTKEYSESSSAQELYTVLLTKEKRISDLLANVQKLESNVLDLQENVKEKDSVIDARTKAITLMTENLSRKGKNTLDALDETKEQMRKMQENFVALEADMKARQMKLLDDLRQKNYEIAELQEINGSLEKQMEELKETRPAEDTEYTEELEGLRGDNSRLTETVAQKESKIKELEESIAAFKQKESDNTESEEISKLKKQLEESNKNMIKVKAQHKSKVKELTKKIDAFKKVSDVNAEIVKFEAENSRLQQRIAELEEEKGSLQLKLVESDSVKGSEAPEYKIELEERIQDHERQLEEKDKVISILEAEISRSKSELVSLTEKLTALSHLENAQVTSEMASIQFEEQMESLENEKKQLSTENDTLAKDKEQLLETIEQLKKEKAEISGKLDHYIQENMELIDKLEKLSAEKVSSAESIEIVEALTQQEKLELEAYQKNLDMVAGNLKTSEENLPQKIELFTVERREVMEKMEQLKQENLSLSLKIKEIENNRDVLAETYEQLQSEKEVLDAKIETVEGENTTLKEKLNQMSENTRDDEDQSAKIKELEDEISTTRKITEDLEAQNSSLKEKLNQQNEDREKDDTASKEIEEKSSRIRQLEDEIASNRNLVEEKETQLHDLTQLVQTAQSQLDDRSKEISQLNNTIIDLNRTLADLENDNKSLQMKITQLEEHKSNLNQLIDKNQEELEAISNTEWENRRLLESKDNEITKLMKERDNTESVILDLQKTIREKDETFHKMTSDFKNKYLHLQKQLEENSGSLQNITAPLQAKIEELTSKNKEQLEKMKKIAANLKKKNQAYQELEDKLKDSQSRHEVEIKTSLQQLHDLESEFSRLQQQLDDKCEEVRVLEEKNVDLQNVITELRVKVDKSNEVSLQQELLLTKENLGSVESSLRAKIQELEMIIETQEGELTKVRDRCSRLEEGISFVEERRLSLERKANELGAELEEKAITCEEMSRSEDLLEKRLAALTAHDEAIEKKLEDAVSDNQELNQQNQKLAAKNEKLKKIVEEFREKIRDLEGQQGVVEELETQNEELKKQIHVLESDLKTLQNEYEKMVEESKNDFDKVSGDWQAQFEEILTEKGELMIKCEKFEEELKEITEKELGFNNELIEYKTKLESSEVEMRSYEEQIQRLSKEKEELEKLRETVIQQEDVIRNYEENMSSMTTQNDEAKKELEALKQALVEKEENIQSLRSENEDIKTTESELRKIITDKESDLQNLHRQQPSHNLASFFDTVPREDPAVTRLQQELASSRTKIEDLEKTIQSLKPTVPDSQPIPTFVWSGQTSDPFDFIEPTKATTLNAPPPPENTHQDLQDKVKTLEFMLFNSEREKEDALGQCQELTNELTRLIYEKQQNVESQILQPSDIIDTPDTCKDLRKIEFEETQAPQVSSLEGGPVVEEVVHAKDAYLCYGDDKQVESQILSEVDIADTPATRRELLNLEFEETQTPISSDRPVKEEPCTSREAYLCYNTFGENDDGWGWGPEEAKLEEEHQRSENVDSLCTRIRVLEAERENHLEEIRQLQVKSGKLIKKLKEFKVKNEELSQRKKSEGDLFNLDDAIQEELKLQIQQVEKKLKETAAELEKERSEKGAIVKKIDILTTANERMVEMKEKQDIELLGWQQNVRELSAKLERLEWGDDGFASVDKSSPAKIKVETGEGELLAKRIEELNETIKELTLDNEELQALLEEQRELRIQAEKSTSQVDPEREILAEETKRLQRELQVSVEEKKQLQDETNELIRKNTELSHKFDDIQKQYSELDAFRATKDDLIAQLNAKLSDAEVSLENDKDRLVQEMDSIRESVETENHQLLTELQEKNVQIEALITSQASTEQEKLSLLNELQDKNAQIESLRASMTSQTSTEHEKEVLFKELQQKNAQIHTLQESLDADISSLKQELDNEIKKAETLVQEKQVLSETLSGKETEIVRLSAAMEQMTQEWDMRIDQRGFDVAESWKLHLESRETEFAQIETLLRKEIGELEEKTNALVNENNELRKNVDAEIRNEVDRVAALQQQINDRQQYINDLTRSLQEKQSEVEKIQEELDSTKKGLEDEKMIIDAVIQFINQSKEVVERDKDSLIKVYSEKEQTILTLQRELEETKSTLTRLQEEHSAKLQEVQTLANQLEERNQTITALTNRVQEMQHLKDYEHENIENLQQNLLDYQQINTNINSQLQMKSSQLDDKEREIGRWKQTLDEKDREHAYAIENLSQEYRASINEQSQEIETLKRRIADTENHYEELLSSRESELESARFELGNQSETATSKTKEIDALAAQLSAKIEECASLEAKINEQSVLIDEENRQLSELRGIIEEQVLKIEDLKTELYQKSNDYDSLIAEMDISRTNVKATEPSRPKVEENEDLTEPVSRAELDLALYMLHQRDVRCEELTVELTQLLEERDTLQLRLSNVIREKEELGRKIKDVEVVEAAVAPSTSTSDKVKMEVAVEAFDPLTTKLSELKTVGYKKDKTIVDEQELRRLQQFSIMQQHRDAASKLPPEAAARLVDASYTLSRDVQSPSKVLLNWLWGRSTPKVNNI
ncbi:protein lava lamp-like isoform X2 [Zophobas morio]|uniref:protein lava lamp-like isoform X2 n=1 Tax=Zophobas morio TaxID=2755281 RepID=UPI0030830BB4